MAMASVCGMEWRIIRASLDLQLERGIKHLPNVTRILTRLRAVRHDERKGSSPVKVGLRIQDRIGFVIVSALAI